MGKFRYVLSGSFYSQELGDYDTLEEALAQFNNLSDISEVYDGNVGWTNQSSYESSVK